MKYVTALVFRQLHELYSRDEIRSFIQMLLEDVCGLSLVDQILGKDKQISDIERKQIIEIVERLKKMEPIQYAFGETWFYSIRLKVNQSVMIPRHETETLVYLVDYYSRKKSRTKLKTLRILDLCTGSGCIAVALSKNIPNSLVDAVDNSESALEVARENFKRHHIEAVTKKIDILDTKKAMEEITGGYDIIVSNPPYVLESEKASMSANVLDYEPHQALFVPDNNPILFYEAIAEIALKKLKRNGRIFVEINPLCSHLILDMLREKGFIYPKAIHDLSGKDRFITARKNG